MTLTTSQFKRKNRFDIETVHSHREYIELKKQLYGYSDAAAIFSRLFIKRLIENVNQVTTIEFNSHVLIDEITDTGKQFKGYYRVGESLGKKFECMGACGPGCPRFGVVEAFTKECLAHDVCVLRFGIDDKRQREKHPECGSLYTKAKSSWLKYGHFFQKVI